MGAALTTNLYITPDQLKDSPILWFTLTAEAVLGRMYPIAVPLIAPPLWVLLNFIRMSYQRGFPAMKANIPNDFQVSVMASVTALAASMVARQYLAFPNSPMLGIAAAAIFTGLGAHEAYWFGAYGGFGTKGAQHQHNPVWQRPPFLPFMIGSILTIWLMRQMTFY